MGPSHLDWRIRSASHCSLTRAFTEPEVLHVDQLGDFGGDVCHRIFCNAQAASRAQQGADLSESLVRRSVHNRDELTARCPMALYRCCASTHDAMVRSTSDTIRVVCVDTCGMTRVRLLARRERAEFADTKSPRTADRQVECDNRQPY